MNNKDLAKILIEELFRLRYKETNELISRTFEYPVISEKHHQQIINLVQKIFNENHNPVIGTLEAKVFVYEGIIKKSNFKAILKKEETE